MFERLESSEQKASASSSSGANNIFRTNNNNEEIKDNLSEAEVSANILCLELYNFQNFRKYFY